MKKLYFILSCNGSMLSKMIRLASQDEYSHVSISLDKELKEMYSFGRRNPYNPLFGGFVQESPDFGTFKRFLKTTKVNIYSLEITDDQYKEIKHKLKTIYQMKEKYRFNRLGLILARFRFQFKRKECYFCSEFIKKILDEFGVENNLPDVAKPDDFKKLDHARLDYRGMLKNYRSFLKG